MSRARAHEVLQLLATDRPPFGGSDAATQRADGRQGGAELLRWLAGEIPVGGATIETGCGDSTVLFAVLSGAHTVVSPDPAEHQRIQAWCAQHGIDTAHVRFVAERSERYLPAAAAEGGLGAVDAVLVDGDHAHPIPSIDWFYAAPALKAGGLLVVDATSIRACGDLAAFLDAEPGWDRRTTIDDAAVYRRTGDGSDGSDGRSWQDQPWNRVRPSLDSRLRSTLGAVRPRQRLQRLLGRS